MTGVGAQRGIGRVVARHLAEEGCSLARVSAAGADEITLELLTHGAQAEGAVTDLSSAEPIAAAFAHFDQSCHNGAVTIAVRIFTPSRHRRPSFRAQLDHGENPWSACTFSAMRICCSRVALLGSGA